MSYTNIDDPTLYFNTKLYTGTGSAQSVTGVGFQPDLVWVKRRNGTQNHVLEDVVRGTTKALYSNLSNAEENQATSITSFDSDGFTTGAFDDTNINTGTFASWNWLAGGSASSNTDGSITSNVSANTTSGFSIVSYTGTGSNATIGHGLGSTPAMIIWKNRSASNGWITYHHKNTSAPETDYLELHSTNGTNDLNTIMNDTAPTSSVFTVGTEGAVNNSGNNFIAYCFAEKKGYSKFGSYTGNGSSSDGTFVYTGFRPAWIMIKCSNAAGELWHIHDTKRTPTNTGTNSDGRIVYANSSAAETDSVHYRIEIYSNGFKAMNNNDSTNVSGNTYIYMCFAELPFVTSTGIPTTAR